MDAVNCISKAMEGHRQNDRQKLAEGLGEALLVIDPIAETYHYDIEDVTDQKRDYNAKRAEHKPEARTGAGRLDAPAGRTLGLTPNNDTGAQAVKAPQKAQNGP